MCYVQINIKCKMYIRIEWTTNHESQVEQVTSSTGIDTSRETQKVSGVNGGSPLLHRPKVVIFS